MSYLLAASAAVALAIATSAMAQSTVQSAPAPAGSGVGVGAVVDLLVLQQALFYRYVLGLPPFGPSAEAGAASLEDAGPPSTADDAAEEPLPTVQSISIEDASSPEADAEVDAAISLDAGVPEDDAGSADADEDWIGVSSAPTSAENGGTLGGAAGASGSPPGSAQSSYHHHASGAPYWFAASGIGGLGILAILVFARARARPARVASLPARDRFARATSPH